MFRLRNITLYRGNINKEYNFSDNAYIYGRNNVGKTALTEVIDFVLGSSLMLSKEGLDNIEGVIAQLVNKKTVLWIKRNIHNEFFYKRTVESKYIQVSNEAYKKIVCEIINDSKDDKAIKVYQKVFDEIPTYRSFSFLNFVDEIGQGDLGSIFTRGKETRYYIRIRKMMDFFFNYENIEKIYEANIELDQLEKELKKYDVILERYSDSVNRLQKLFISLGLKYSKDMSENYKLFKNYQRTFSRKKMECTDDLIYLTKASHSLSEELKLYSFIKEQCKFAGARRSRSEYLLTILNSIISDNNDYSEEVEVITSKIKEIQQDELILSIADYDSSICKIEEQKKNIDEKIELIKSQSSKTDYDSTVKMQGIVEECFSVINSFVDSERVDSMKKRVNILKTRIKDLKNSYSKKGINDFNTRLTQMYIENNISRVPYLIEDRKEECFSLSFDPFSQALVANHKEGNAIVSYTPGSMARHNHLQLLVYLCMLEYLYNNFRSFIYLPILIIDSANQPMEEETFDEVYPSIIDVAKKIGVQTIFLSKTLPKSVDIDDLVDINEGLNPFHQTSE